MVMMILLSCATVVLGLPYSYRTHVVFLAYLPEPEPSEKDVEEQRNELKRSASGPERDALMAQTYYPHRRKLIVT